VRQEHIGDRARATAVAAARWGIAGLVAMVPDELPSFFHVGLDRTVLVFSLAITIGAGLVFGAVPARYGTRGQLADALQGRGADLLGGTGVRQFFVAVQLGLCIVLLVGAGLLARSFNRLQQVPLGLNPDHVVTAELRLPITKYDNDTVVTEFGRCRGSRWTWRSCSSPADHAPARRQV
jgi:hypothetical protein